MSMITRNCRKSGVEFQISEADQEYYQRVNVPFPTLCPEERLRRRLAYRNPITVYGRKSSATGNSTFSMFSETAPFPVIEKDIWWGDSWEGQEFQRDYDRAVPFLDQFFRLSKEVPRFPLSIIRIENSEYVNNATALKECYLVFGANYSENCLYCYRINNCKDCLECTELFFSELCYNCVMCERCYNLQDSVFCEDCSDSYFLKNCRSCRSCFGCVNLYRKEYCIYNKSYSREQYQDFMAKQQLSSYQGRCALRDQFWEFQIQQPCPAVKSRQVSEVSGNYIYESRRVTSSFNIRRAENVAHCYELNEVKDCLDYSIWGSESELIYECGSCGNRAYNLKFCYECFENVSDLEYCQFCISCRNCFGCVGLRHKEYCILNKQYSKDEYHRQIEEIKKLMLERGEYGEFFPIKESPIPYNHSMACWYFPLSRQEALARGLSWYDNPDETARRGILAKDLPDLLPESDQSLIVQSSCSNRTFKITSAEIKRYREFKVPLPRLRYDERIKERQALLGGVKLLERVCSKTGEKLLTTFTSELAPVLWSCKAYNQEFKS